METLFKKSKIKFDKNDNTILSKSKLTSLINNAVLDRKVIESRTLASEFYILIDSKLLEFYIIEQNEMLEWKTDGSFEQNDKLYKATLVE